MRTLPALPLLAIASAACALPAGGHSHVEIVYRENRLRLVYFDFDEGEANPADVTLFVGSPAARAVPDQPAFAALLGEAGATTWILPEGAEPDLLWLGIGNGSLRAAEFAGPLTLSLQAVEGPGHFAVFQNGAFGSPMTHMNTRDGIGPWDAISLPLGSHFHCNWAFSAPGLYRVRFVISGVRRIGNTPVASEPTEFVFAVEPPPPPTLVFHRTPTNTLHLSVSGQAGLNYRIEASERLADWVFLTRLPASGTWTASPFDPPVSPHRFYRARLH